MKILIAVDSFKDSLNAIDVAAAIARGAQQAMPKAEVVPFPLADGGEGTLEALVHHARGSFQTALVKDPLFRDIEARWGLSADGQTAFVGMAEASGLQLLKPEERNCTFTTTFGTGQLILEALRSGAQHIVLAIGGSATNDVGIGMATALGYRILDAKGQAVKPVGGKLGTIQRIEDAELRFDPSSLNVTVLCDVENPLYGPQGAAHTYAGQKGASPDEIELLESGLQHFAGILKEHVKKDVASIPGAGAAGGMGAGAMAFLGAQKRSGAEFVLEASNFEQALSEVDLVLTGEGSIDEQTSYGKLVHRIVELSNKRNIPVIGLCGTLALSPKQIEKLGLRAAYSCMTRPAALREVLPETATALEQLAWQICRTWSKP